LWQPGVCPRLAVLFVSRIPYLILYALFQPLTALAVEKQQESGTRMREEHVTLDGFGRLLAWFGPYELPLFDRLKTILLQPWFHGHIESGDAESKLSGQPKGSYLVRLSSVPGCFTISKVGKNGQISHQRIDFNPAKGFSVIKQTSDGATREATTPGLNLEAFLSSHSAELFLLTPIECTTWKYLFVTSSVEGYLNVSSAAFRVAAFVDILSCRSLQTTTEELTSCSLFYLCFVVALPVYT
jgi:hypothetical protein